MSDLEALPEMNDAPIRVPLGLRIVGWLFIVAGTGSLLTMAYGFARRQLHLDFNVVCLFIGWGLLRRRAPWRTWALVFTWIGLVAVALLFVVICFEKGPSPIMLDGRDWADVPKAWALVATAAALAVGVWIYRVLTRADVRELFLLESADGRHAATQRRLVPIWFIVVALSLAVASFVFARIADQQKGSVDHRATQRDNTTGG